jgi:hypothetical protein
VLRLTGLPALSWAPRARVERRVDTVALRFLADDGATVTTVGIPPYTLAGADLEAVELRLLADLEDRGYRVERAEPAT